MIDTPVTLPGTYTIQVAGYASLLTNYRVDNVVGRAVAPEKRSMAMGIASAAGSFGQFAMVPGTLGLISWLGWSAALLALGLMVALILPLVSMLKDRPLPVMAGQQTLREALKEACSHSGFWLLAFVVGFQCATVSCSDAVWLPSA